jgi:LL-diaminopimelate aminotransferase
MNMHDFADRLKHLPFYLYPTIEATTHQALKKGQDIIDLSTGDPAFATPTYIVEKLQEASKNPANHHYGSVAGRAEFRKAIARWYHRRFGVTLDSDREIITFGGSKEGIAFLPLAFINDGDIALIPDPGYPTYRYAAAFANAALQTFPLRPENNYQPDFGEIPESITQKAKIIFLNYPNNPTAATAEKDLFARAVEFADRHNIIICHDAAYSEITFDGYKAPSLLEIEGAKEVGVEFHTLSKTFCMTGWRAGFAVGNRKIIEGLLEVKKVSTSGHFAAVEIAGTEALDREPLELDRNNKEFEKRRDFVIGELNRFGIPIQPPRGSYYIWFPIPKERDSLSFAKKLILETGVVTFPGIGYGTNGEGYLRIAIVPELPRIQEAFGRLEPYLRAS